MTVTRTHSNQRMSQLVVHNDTAYLAGQVADDFSADIKTQTTSCLAKVDALLTAAGSDKDHILSTTIFIRTMAQFAEMNEIWDAWIADHGKPARACVEANMATDQILVEVCVIAAVKS
ncbi:MAG: RidA family protein [Rhodobacteraceae bacterium]|nr:RidA family protein [Paracoccaceae bacterium]